MSVEILLLAVLVGLTLLAYMIAINAQGATRLIFSFLFATVMLAGSVWAIVQHHSAQVENMNSEQLRRLEFEKRVVEERLESKEQVLRDNKVLMSHASRVSANIATGIGLATSLIDVNLQDPKVDLDGLMVRAADIKRRVDELRGEFNKTKEIGNFPEAAALIKDAMHLLGESCHYHRIYYYAENTAQELARERVVRKKAQEALEKFQNASTMVVKVDE